MGDWQLDRLPEEIRQDAEQAARRDGVPLHRWLGKLIRDTCAEEGVPLSRELSAIDRNKPLADQLHRPGDIPPRPGLEPIVVMPEAHATEGVRMVELWAAVRNGFARNDRRNEAVTSTAVRALHSSEPRRQTPEQRWPETLPLASQPMPLATSSIASPALRPPAKAPSSGPNASTGGSATPDTALIAASRTTAPIVPKPVVSPHHGLAVQPAPPPEQTAPGTRPTSTVSFSSSASRSDERSGPLTTLVRRLRRNELSPIAESSLFAKLIDEQTASISDIARATGRTEEQIARSLRLLSLPEKERDMIDRGALSRAAAFKLLDSSVLEPANPIVPAGPRMP